MAKTCPSCGYSPIGPFTDNCPMCAEPVRNVRSDGGGFPRLPKLPAHQWIIGGVVVGVLVVFGCCGLGMWQMNTAFKDMQDQIAQAQAEHEANRRARTVVVTAADLVREFQNDPVAADQKYAGKYLEIAGVVERTGRGRYEAQFVILHGGDENAKVKIECFFDPVYDEDEGRVKEDGAGVKRLGKGQTITVRGEYDGRVSNVQLRECVLVR
jgi:membrane-bound lytic murein transglycosylase